MEAISLAGVSGRFPCDSGGNKQMLQMLQNSIGWVPLNRSHMNMAVPRAYTLARPFFEDLSVSKRRLQKRGFSAVSVRLTAESSVVQSTYVEETPEQEQDYEYEDISYTQNDASSSSTEIFSGAPADRAELHAIRTNFMRAKLLRKLSEANQYNRSLQRTVQETNDTLLKCKAELAAMEMELGVLVNLAQEIAREGGRPGTRKINGRYADSHLAYRLEDLYNRLASQVKDVDTVRLRDIPVEWYGLAEDVRVMGSFDGWTEGEQLSPEESAGTYTKFSGLVKLRPGHYQIKFLVDGVWQVSPQLPTVGEGLTINNLLTVE